MSANNNDLLSSLESLQASLETVTKEISTRPDLNSRYAKENQVFENYNMELAALEGKLKQKQSLSDAEVQKIAQDTRTVIAPQINEMISTNTKVLGMGQLNLAKDLSENSAKTLNQRLSASKSDVTSFFSALQSVEGAAADVPEIKAAGKPTFAKPPTLKELSAAFGEVLQKISYAKGKA